MQWLSNLNSIIRFVDMNVDMATDITDVFKGHTAATDQSRLAFFVTDSPERIHSCLISSFL